MVKKCGYAINVAENLLTKKAIRDILHYVI